MRLWAPHDVSVCTAKRDPHHGEVRRNRSYLPEAGPCYEAGCYCKYIVLRYIVAA